MKKMILLLATFACSGLNAVLDDATRLQLKAAYEQGQAQEESEETHLSFTEELDRICGDYFQRNSEKLRSTSAAGSYCKFANEISKDPELSELDPQGKMYRYIDMQGRME